MKNYKTIRSKRKTLALVVNQDAQIVVRAPFNISDKFIEKFVNDHKKWIAKKQEKFKNRTPAREKEFVNGENFVFLGKNYKLNIVKDRSNHIKLKDALYISEDVLSDASMHITNWYKMLAREKITERVNWYSNILGLYPKSVRITNAQKRWGSCGSGGSVNFSWRLVMAPLDIIDYVVLHELVHIEEKNHSKCFWNKMKVLCPNYENKKKWLEENGHLLRI